MKMFLLSLLQLVSASVFAHDWYWQHPVPQGNTLLKISFANERCGYAVGEAGTILYTGNGGESWDIQFEGITENILDVCAVDSATAWFIGDNGLLCRTTDGGYHWMTQTSGTTNGLNSVYFLSKSIGWACGDNKTILRTTDGGNTWLQASFTTQVLIGFNSIYFSTPLEGWAVGSSTSGGGGGGGTSLSGVLYHSIDGGASWTLQATQLGISFLRVKLFAGVGLAVGSNGRVLRSTNAGASWELLSSGVTTGLNDIAFSSATEFWIATDDSSLLHSTNGGSSWAMEPFSGSYAAINGIACCSGTSVAVGESGFLARRVASTSWTIPNTGDNPAVNWMSFSNSANGFAVGQYGTILRTTNSGVSWTDQRSNAPGNSYYGIAVEGPSHAWAVGDLGVLIHTTDGGAHWEQQQTVFPETPTLYGVSFVDQSNGWAVGENGVVIHTTNGGTQWVRQNSGGIQALYGITFVDSNNGWISGSAGTMLHTTNGGSTWTTQSSETAATLWNVNFLTPTTGFAAGSDGIILRTTNGGDAWLSSPSGTAQNLYVVLPQSEKIVWAVGDTGTVLYSSDGGNTWESDFAGSWYCLYGLSVADDSSISVCGENGTITTCLSPSQLLSLSRTPVPAVPEAWTLRQNYPNPFNPSTQISFTTPPTYTGRATITVTDILGRTLSTPFDAAVLGGTHSFEWKAENARSGVYFYTLRARPFRATKRMMLLR